MEILIPPYAQGSCGITHVDSGLLQYFRDHHHVSTMLDVGCGPGGQVKAAQDLGILATGIDADIRLYRQPGVLVGDVTDPTLRFPPVDLIWSVEVAEHIPPELCDAYLDFMARTAGRFIVMTTNQWVAPLHVNCQPPEWWRAQMSKRGWDPADWSDLAIAQHSTMEREFLRETGQIYARAA